MFGREALQTACRVIRTGVGHWHARPHISRAIRNTNILDKNGILGLFENRRQPTGGIGRRASGEPLVCCIPRIDTACRLAHIKKQLDYPGSDRARSC